MNNLIIKRVLLAAVLMTMAAISHAASQGMTLPVGFNRQKIAQGAVASVDNLLLESGDNFLLESGDLLILESGVGFLPEAGYGWSGNVADGQTFTITQSSGFGTKAQAAAKVFDQFDQYYDNGSVTTPYSALNDGDTLPSAATDPFDAHTGVWTKDVAGAYGTRSAAYKSPVDAAGGNLDYWLDTWLGWPSADGNKIYARWYFQIEESGHIKQALDGAHSTSATVLNITPGHASWFTDASASSFHTTVVELDDASLHRTVQVDPKLTTTSLNIADGLAGAAASGNDFYFRINDSTKFIRIWDVVSGSSDLLQVSWTWSQITNLGPVGNNDSDTNANPRAGGAATWNLMEIELFHAQEEVDKATSFYKAWLNGVQIGSTLNHNISKDSGTWPFSGIVPRLIGQDTSAAFERWLLPNNFLRLAEIYADTTTQRIEIGDHATDLFQSIIREVCPITGWVDGQVDFIANQGRHPTLLGTYFYWVDGANSATLMGQVN